MLGILCKEVKVKYVRMKEKELKGRERDEVAF